MKEMLLTFVLLTSPLIADEPLWVLDSYSCRWRCYELSCLIHEIQYEIEDLNADNIEKVQRECYDLISDCQDILIGN